MSFFEDLGKITMVAAGDRIRGVGWLDAQHPYSRGPVNPEFLDRLKQYAALSVQSEKVLRWGMFLGGHLCEFCEKVYGSLNCGVPFKGLLFVFPELMVHYVGTHSYLPPDVFVTAVMQAPLPGSPEYRAEVLSIFPELRDRPRCESDLKFFRAIGPEIGPETCRHADCDRKRVQCSVMCRRHHFEMVMNDFCPYNDDDL
jgi:hypothetical protein